jgi:ankyrin repeat protein
MRASSKSFLNASLVRRVRVRGSCVVRRTLLSHNTCLVSNPPDTDLLIGAGSSDLTPLYVACELANADLVSLLLKKGQPINTRVRTQETRGACRVSRVACVARAHRRGWLCLQIPGYHYWTVLHRASADGNIKLVNLLLANGADPTIRGLISKTPYDLAPNKETRNAFRR